MALRYLKPKRNSVSFITMISTSGVALGVWVLILVIAVMTGFDQEMRRKVLGFDAHVMVMTDSVLRDWRDVEEMASKVPHVLATAPFVQGPVIAEFEGRRITPKIRGIDPEREQGVTDVRRSIKEGKFDLEADEQGISNKAIVGREMAKELNLHIGDKITIYSPGNISAMLEEIKRAKKEGGKGKALDELEAMILPSDLIVTGIFESGRFVYDAEFILVPLHIGQELYGLGDAVHGLTMRTDDPYQVGTVQDELLRKLPMGLSVLTWIDMNSQFFDALRMERNVMFIILLTVVLVASFGITSNLITVTVQKRREIGVMKALGATSFQIMQIFTAQGFVIGVLGNAVGFLSAMVTLHWRNEAKDFLARVFHVELFPARIYQFQALPAEIVPRDVTAICVMALVICTLAALIPAFLASRLEPVKALRYE